MFVYIFSTHVITLCTRFDICSSVKVNSGERYPNRVVSFGLNRAYIKFRTPNSCCTDNTWFFEYFYEFLGFVVWKISGHFGGVYQSRYCASDGAFLFSFVYVMYLNIASYLCGKQIKSTLGNTMCLWMIFIFVHFKRLGLNECRTRTLKEENERVSCKSYQLNSHVSKLPGIVYFYLTLTICRSKILFIHFYTTHP